MRWENFIVEKVKSENAKITKTQQLVADYFVKHTEKATYMTVNQIAQEVGVSETTVIRFALSLGYKKFSEFQDELQSKILGDRTVHRLQKSNTEVKEVGVLSSSFHQDIDNLGRTLNQINEVEFNKVVEIISNTNQITVLGLRSSLTDAYYLGFSLNAMLGNVNIITNDNGIDLEASLLKINEQSIVIVFTYTRFTIGTLEVLKYLKNEHDCTVVTITNSVRCPTIPYSNFVFLMDIDSFTPMQSHVSSFAFSNALISAVGLKQKNRVESNLNKLEKYYSNGNLFYEK
ncbi:MurR/RpiR family transcriptional regulator [Bacillus sp. N1-1]|uniref:MurR/RpiR family transcriptional regulator n=1 Tax=Bacillus sp. N1-1 TaxID=2682541 RepID=UPI0013197AA8|nr:MurR/RpiR family transcriptional regulator [Bacillus sp. N1-1]QHA93074.1 SIS domain-containing protein [Bacillus sp. N1-1]